MTLSDVVILQPLVPLYRQQFFEGFSKITSMKIYTYHSSEFLSANGFAAAQIETTHIAKLSIGKAIFINILPLLFGPHRVIVLCAENKIISNWIILLLGRIIGKKVILWGHGLDARFYLEQANKMPFMRILMYRLADGAWFYTEKEQTIWCKILPDLKSVALGNTLDISLIKPLIIEKEKEFLKKHYGIKTDINFIFCARFNSLNRRVDLLLSLIEKMDKNRFGFIIIGGGHLKPDFTGIENVYDFGAVYDREKKNDLFGLADIYFQPAWIGLSVVEAMAYGKPVFTLRRSKEILHGVEYGYIQNGVNGKIFQNIDELFDYVNRVEELEFQKLGFCAREFVWEHLTVEKMVANAIKGLNLARQA